LGLSRNVSANNIKLGNSAEAFRDYGFAQVKIYSQPQVSLIGKFAKSWIYGLLEKWTHGNEDIYPLEKYHLWFSSLGVDHSSIFCARNRHIYPTVEIKEAIINENVEMFLFDIGIKKFEIWDESLGWLGFRFIRPGFGDGYPLSRKEWGPAKNVISCWVPVIGLDPKQTITLVPGSHLKEYDKFIPQDDKFMKGEYRLADTKEAIKLYNPKLNDVEAIFYHPKMLHSEDVKTGNITRLNLEFRVNPL